MGDILKLSLFILLFSLNANASTLSDFAKIIQFVNPTTNSISETECENVDLSDHFGPVRNQGRTNWCTFFVAADLMTYLQGVAPKGQISVLDVATTYFASESNEARKELQNYTLTDAVSDPFRAVKSYQNQSGYCLEEQSNPPLANFKDYKQLVLSSAATPTDAETLPDLNKALVFSLHQKLEKRCAQREPMQAMEPLSSKLFAGVKLSSAEKLLKALKQRLPAGIGYKNNFMIGDESAPNAAPVHASVITGSRWNAKARRCEFKLRDSYGPNCGIYLQGVRERCHEGYTWLTENEINNSVKKIFVIGSRKLAEGLSANLSKEN